MELTFSNHLFNEWKNIVPVSTKGCLFLIFSTSHAHWQLQSWFEIPEFHSESHSSFDMNIPFVTTLLEEMVACSHYWWLIWILSCLELLSCELAAWSSEAENWGRLGSEMGSTQQELSDQSRGEKEVRCEIKVQELGRYTGDPSSPEDGGLWLDPLWKMFHRQVPWAGLLLSGPWRVLCNWSGFGFPPHKGDTISQHYLASLMSIWSDKLWKPGGSLVCFNHMAPGLLLIFRFTVLGLILAVHQNQL